ncbi:MAG: hypothetical protein IKA71_05585 [Lentisphaeria bacterium]|nr:hypothetical protein [Lentisphaeria bacterium]
MAWMQTFLTAHPHTVCVLGGNRLAFACKLPFRRLLRGYGGEAPVKDGSP